jgi:protein gp37
MNQQTPPATAYSPAEVARWEKLGTRISWCHWVLNLWTGCAKVSSGCKNCYAEAWAKRSGKRVWGRKAERPRSKTWARLATYRKLVIDPRWRAWQGLLEGERPRVFIGSLMDWAEGREDQAPMVAEMWTLISGAPELDFLLLTKRPQNIPRLLPDDWGRGYPNVWLMTSIESGADSARDAETGRPVIERAADLLRVPAAVHGVSYEPAIGPLAKQLKPYFHDARCPVSKWLKLPVESILSAFSPVAIPDCMCASGAFRINWVIYGAESGAGHRPEGTPGDPKLWAREMRDASRSHGVAFFHKQSAHRFNERGVDLDGDIIHEYPIPRQE